jgi:nucleotide-binding universal stress UspA family protein
MKWIVGLDLRPSSQGAIRFARQLSETSEHDAMVGVHVLEEAHLQPALRYHHLDELMATVREVAERVVADCGASAVLEALEIVQGVHAERSLEAAREYHYCDAIIVGRQAPRDGHRLLRLGRVARRLLRSLDSPVVVVPPDYEATDLEGPVVVSTNLREDSEDALRFAADMAERLGCPLVVLHVVPYADDYGAHYIPEESRKKIAADNQREGEADLHGWLEGLGIEDAEELVVQGGVVEQVISVATERGATLLVSGSRVLSVLERLLLTSIGSELAASAPCPVAVVPPRLTPPDLRTT